MLIYNNKKSTPYIITDVGYYILLRLWQLQEVRSPTPLQQTIPNRSMSIGLNVAHVVVGTFLRIIRLVNRIFLPNSTKSIICVARVVWNKLSRNVMTRLLLSHRKSENLKMSKRLTPVPRRISLSAPIQLRPTIRRFTRLNVLRLTSQISQTADEVFEIAKRKLNVIIRGLPENENDIEEFVQFANTFHLLPQTLVAEDIASAHRLGRNNTNNQDTPRLLCLRFHSLQTRRVIFHMWKNRAKNCASQPNVYVRPDLTKAQLTVDKQLRQQLLVKGKDQYMIFRGKIVNRTVSNNLPITTNHINGNDNMASSLSQPDQLHSSLLPPPVTFESYPMLGTSTSFASTSQGCNNTPTVTSHSASHFPCLGLDSSAKSHIIPTDVLPPAENLVTSMSPSLSAVDKQSHSTTKQSDSTNGSDQNSNPSQLVSKPAQRVRTSLDYHKSASPIVSSQDKYLTARAPGQMKASLCQATSPSVSPSSLPSRLNSSDRPKSTASVTTQRKSTRHTTMTVKANLNNKKNPKEV